MKTWRLFDDGNTINDIGYNLAKKIMKNKVIVIADDNGGILKWLKFSFEDYGAIIHIFEHGKDAIDFMQTNSQNGTIVDILILDLIMNEVGGIEIANKSKEIMPKAMILFITGCSEESEEWIEASELGMVVSKPVGIEKIIGTIIKKNESIAEECN